MTTKAELAVKALNSLANSACLATRTAPTNLTSALPTLVLTSAATQPTDLSPDEGAQSILLAPIIRLTDCSPMANATFTWGNHNSTDFRQWTVS